METRVPYALQGVMPNEEELSDKQARILDFIQVFHAQNDRPPTNREIGHGVGIRSTSHVNYHLRILEEKGYIERIRNTSRGLRLKSIPRHGEGDVVSVPVWGKIAAGEPIEARRLADQSISVSAEFVPADGDVYALQVKGTSMIDALIDDGDWIIVRPQPNPENGDMVVATLTSERGDEREATLKRFYREGDRIRLQPANSTMDPIYVEPERVLVQGKVVAVLRKL